MKKNVDCEDLSLGKLGFTIWLIPIGIMFFSLISFTGFHILITKPKSSLQDIVYLLIIINLFFGVSIWFSYQLLVGLKIIQEIKINNSDIEVIFYFRKRRKLKFENIDSIHLLEKNGYLLRKHRCVQTNKPCLEIKLKDNTKYLITPNMERFDELKEIILNKMQAVS